MKYTAKVDTLLKRKPEQGSTLSDSEKKLVPAGTHYFIEEILDTDGLHSQVELQFEAGTWWVFLPHWDTNSEPQQITATFYLKQARVPNLIYGSLVFKEGDKEILNVRATSGQPGYQYSGAHSIRAKGCLPPGKDWKINTSGYFVSRAKQPGIAGMFYHITPDPDSETGRGEFGLHLDANEEVYPGSAGCIVVKKGHGFDERVRPLVDSLRGTQDHIPLEVIYS